MVLSFVHSLGGPLVVTQGGGYSEPIERTAEAHARTFLAAAKVFRDSQ